MGTHDTQAAPRARAAGAGGSVDGADLTLGLALTVAAGVIYAATSHGDWIFDTLRYADYTQEGELSSLILLLHTLANLIPLAAFEALGLVGYDGGSLPVLEAFAIAGGAVAVGVVFAGARTLGCSRPAAVAAAALFAVSLGAWRGAGGAGVYGLTQLALALAWLAAIRFALAPSMRRAALLGAAGGLALSTHLATITFLPVAVALAAVAGGPDARGRVRTAAAAVGGIVAVALPVFVLGAGLATDWSAEGMKTWFLGPHVPEADPSRTVGFGFDGLTTTVASELPAPGAGPFTDSPQAVATLATALVLALALAGAVAGGRRRASRTLAMALAGGALLAVLAAGAYQAERPDYFSLALVPLALLWGLGVHAVAGALGPVRPAWAAGATLVLAVSLFAWNLEGEVGQTLDRSEQRELAGAEITAALEPDARVALSPQIAPRVAYEGERAETGWAALLGEVNAGAPKPGVRAWVTAEPEPPFASSRAFELTPAQAEFLGADAGAVWRELRRCCAPVAVAEFATDGGPETLYRLTPPSVPATRPAG